MIVRTRQQLRGLEVIPIASGEGAKEAVNKQSIWPGIAVGVSVYVITRLLDAWLFGRRAA